MFEEIQSHQLFMVGTPAESSMTNDFNTNTKIENEAYAAQTAILMGISAAILTRVLSHATVYCTDSYKSILKQYNSVVQRQRQLFKLTPREELYGREATPAKTEFQKNISQSRLLKKHVFRVSARSIMLIQISALCAMGSARGQIKWTFSVTFCSSPFCQL